MCIYFISLASWGHCHFFVGMKKMIAAVCIHKCKHFLKLPLHCVRKLECMMGSCQWKKRQSSWLQANCDAVLDLFLETSSTYVFFVSKQHFVWWAGIVSDASENICQKIKVWFPKNKANGKERISIEDVSNLRKLFFLF